MSTSKDPTVVGTHGASCRKSDGTPCPNWPMKGSTVCSAHLLNPKARANAAIRDRVATFTDGEVPQDPAEVLLQVVHITWLQSALHRAKLHAQAAEGRDPYVRVDVNNREHPAALAVLEQSERRMAGDMAAKAVGADLAGRHVRLMERYADSFELLAVGLARAFGQDPDDAEVRAVIYGQIQQLDAGAA